MKTPLIIMSCAYGLAFMDGALELGLTDGVYTLIGLVAIASLIWMWIVLPKSN